MKMPRSTREISSSVDGPSRVGLQRDVGHPLHRHVTGGVGERAAVGPPEVLQPGHRPVQLVADQQPVLDDVPLLAGDPLVVPADRRQAVLRRPVTGDVHDRGAVLQRAQLVERRERGARVVGLVAQCAVQLGRVADRLVDREEQVARVDDQVVVATVHGRRAQLLGQVLGQLVEVGGPVVAGAGEVLPATSGRGSQRAHGVEPPGLLVDADGLELAVDPHPLLGRRGAGQVAVELVLHHRVHRRVGVRDDVVREQRGAPVGEQRDLLRVRDAERVDLVGRDPRDVAVRRFVGQLDPLGRQRAAHLGHLDGLLGDPLGRLRREVDVRGEAPGPVMQHPHREPDVLTVPGAVQAGVVQAEVRVPHPLNPDVGVLDTEGPGPAQCGVGEPAQGQVGEGRVDLGHWASPRGRTVVRKVGGVRARAPGRGRACRGYVGRRCPRAPAARSPAGSGRRAAPAADRRRAGRATTPSRGADRPAARAHG